MNHRILEGRVAIITGAGRGIGAATARRFAEEGAAVACVSRSAAQLEQVAASIRAAGGRTLAVVCDVTRADDVTAMVARVSSELGPVCLLVNNAGHCAPAPMVSMSPADFHATVDGNLTSTFLCCRAVLPRMLESGGGDIVNVASISGVRGTQKFPGFTAYAASKAGVIVLTEALAAELDGRGVRVNAVSPGSVETELLRRVAPSATAAMSPEEVAESVLFIASSRGRPANGSNLEIFG